MEINLTLTAKTLQLEHQRTDVDHLGKAIGNFGVAVGQAQDAQFLGVGRSGATDERQDPLAEGEPELAGAEANGLDRDILDPLDQADRDRAAGAVERAEQQ